MKIEDQSLLVGCYGKFRRHSWLDAADFEGDAYSLFVSRAWSLGWSSSGSDRAEFDVWGMNEAGQDWDGRESRRVAWFQVGLADGAFPTPVRAVVSCAADVVHRMGELELEAVQVLLPLRSSEPSFWRATSAADWFSIADPGARTDVTVTVDAGEDDAVARAADEIVAEVRRSETGRSLVRGLATHRPATTPSTVPDWRLGDGRHPVTFDCALPEWTPDAAGWLVEVLAAACVAAGVRTSVLVDVAR